MKLSFATALVCLTAVQGFTVLPSARVSVSKGLTPKDPSLSNARDSRDLASRCSVQTQLSLMSAEESESLLKRAEQCVGEECSVDDVADLIDVLHAQQTELFARVEKIKQTVQALEKVNKAEDRPVDEIRETVRAIWRVFQLGDKSSGNDYPSLSKPTVYSGEVGDGPMTAWDALPPKKWKP